MRKTGVQSRGFSLIELILVMAVIAIASVVVVPQFFRSMRGNRLRSAARSVIVSGRYARSMALLKQQVMVMEFDIPGSTVTVRPARVNTNTPALTEDDDNEARMALTAPETGPAVLTDDVNAEVEGTGNVELKRVLDRVNIVSIEVDGAEMFEEDAVVAVQYSNNGRCTPYAVLIKDEFDAAIRIEVDQLAGVRTERQEL